MLLGPLCEALPKSKLPLFAGDPKVFMNLMIGWCFLRLILEPIVGNGDLKEASLWDMSVMVQQT